MEPIVFGEIIEGQEYRQRQAVYGLVYNEKNQIGIIKTPRGHFLPGGGIENDENHTECLQREFIEETGYGVTAGDFIGSAILYGFAPTAKMYYKMTGHFYKAYLNEMIRSKIEEDHEFIWLDVSEAEATMLLEHQAWAIGVASKLN